MIERLFELGLNKKDYKLNITEIFSSIQGEGPYQGYPAHFIRLSGCSLKCKFCDSRYSWKESREYKYEELEFIFESWKENFPNINLVVITGGEPTEQDIRLLVLLAKRFNYTVHIETNGLFKDKKYLSKFVDLYVISPKLLNLKTIEKYPLNLSSFFPLGAYVYKFIASTSAEIYVIKRFCIERGIDLSKIWIMPEGTTEKEIQESSKMIADTCMQLGLKLSGRLHISIWSNKRGV